MIETTFTFRVEDSLKQQFTQAAKDRDRTAAQLLRDFMREFVQQHNPAEHDRWFRQEVQAGVDSAEAGQLLASTDVDARFAARRAATRRRLAASR